MLGTRTLLAAMAAASILTTTGCTADRSGEQEHAGEIAAVIGAKTSIAQAVATAEQRTGGRAIKVDADRERDAFVYDVRTVLRGSVSKVVVDPATGSVVRVAKRGWFDRTFDRDDRDAVAGPAAQATSLATAIATAEQQVGGKTIEAGYERERGAGAYEVEVAKDGIVHRVGIDGASGRVLSVAANERDDHGEHDED